MGLGLRCGTDLTPAVGPAVDDPLALFASALVRAAEGWGLGQFVATHRSGSMLEIELHPAAEPAEAQLLEGGTLVWSAKTSGAGPGYHDLVVSLLDRVGDELGLDWSWRDEASEFEDETCYAEHRDFDRLQQEMAAFFRARSERVVSLIRDERYANVLLDVPVGFGASAPEGEIITPLGRMPIDFFVAAARAGEDDHAAAEQFFPWWDQGLDAQAWRNLGLVILWMEAPWRPPINEKERELTERALLAFDRARAADPSVSLPINEIEELRSLLEAAPDSWVTPGPGVLGYRRQDMRRPLTGGWSVEAPGYFLEDLQDEGVTALYWYGAREIWATTYSVRPAKPASLTDLEDKTGPDSAIIEHHGIVGVSNTSQRTGDNGEVYYVTSCVLHADGSAATLTIVSGSEADLDWAARTFESVRFAPKDAA